MPISDEDLCYTNAAFCYLTRNFHTRICKDLLLYWFDGIWMSFDRILNSANVDRAYDGLLWTLRSLQELSSALLLPNSMMKISSMPPSTLNEFMNGWKVIWSTIVHGLPIFSNIATLTDLPDILHLRKNLLKAVLNHLDWKGYSKLTERMGLYLPSAMFALCVGFLTFTEFFKEIGLVHISFDVIESLDNM
ncbi:serine/threonine-protein kinase ATM-like [Trifolium pratense]|uniref:serine/threonine-protein kinase ATM-like n=1 Tax=Trifolium pratense TaxID=57577 RepID=UPI001E693D35|nr:serine/threonine-protein kinase ATM-like [Trifolium pratense]XP_045795637.1 serine/threonine-protein kinase ATM-like [Trifolium pratense]